MIREIDPQHLSISHLLGKKVMVWLADGNRLKGPRNDYNGFENEDKLNPNSIRFG